MSRALKSLVACGIAAALLSPCGARADDTSASTEFSHHILVTTTVDYSTWFGGSAFNFGDEPSSTATSGGTPILGRKVLDLMGAGPTVGAAVYARTSGGTHVGVAFSHTAWTSQGLTPEEFGLTASLHGHSSPPVSFFYGIDFGFVYDTTRGSKALELLAPYLSGVLGLGIQPPWASWLLLRPHLGLGWAFAPSVESYGEKLSVKGIMARFSGGLSLGVAL